MSQDNDDSVPQDATPDIDELIEQAREQDQNDQANIPAGGDDDLLSQIQDIKMQLARSQADYQNLLRRMRSEQEELGEFTRAKVVTRFLPVVDDLARAIEHLPEDLKVHEWTQGVFALSKNLNRILQDCEVVEFESIGHEVDPDRHDVVSQGPGATDIVIAELEKGYLIGGKILRPAKVVVGNGSES